MKRITILILSVLLTTNMIAATVDTTTAKTIAVNFLHEKLKSQDYSKQKAIDLQLLAEKAKQGGQKNYYIFNLKNTTGFIIISADDRIYPVLGYSFESSYNSNEGNMPDAFLEWLENTNKQIESVRCNNLKAEKATQEAWKYYQNKPISYKKELKSVSALIKTKWNQGTYYNSLCPVDSGGPNNHVWAGCVAVSMAQVMKFWNYPDYGSGQHSYVTNKYGPQSADFASTYYDWNAMPNSLSTENIPVATLLYHCGVSVNMSYAPGGSGASMYTAANVLKTYFDYSHDIKILSKNAFTDNAWDSVLRSELDNGRPMAYSGGNHAFNIDGYDETNHYHLNWGWGGAYDGNFLLTALNPGSSNFTSGQQAIVHIMPNCGMDDTNLKTMTGYSGTITDNGGEYLNYMNCSDSKILIAPPNITKIKLFINEFETISGQDTLFIYDGETETAPLLSTLTDSIGPLEILSSTNKVYLHFKSDNFTTDKGYSINYISAFDDTGVTGLLLPKDKTCGISNDSVMVTIKNYGINTKTNIPVTVKVNTPQGTKTFNKTLNKSLATNQVDTLFMGYINTTSAGTYHYTCYTQTAGDNLVNSNDTTTAAVLIKAIEPIPFIDSIKNYHYEDLGDWTDLNSRTWIYSEGERTNAFFRACVGGGEIGGGNGGRENPNPFLIFDKKIGTISSNAKFYFDYRILMPQLSELPNLTENEKVMLVVSSDCGNDFDTIFTIDANNHIADSAFRRMEVPLGQYTGQNIIIGLTASWDNVFSTIDYDNFLLVDSVPTSVDPDFIAENETLLLFPNPVLDILKIYNNLNFKNKLSISIFNATGKIALKNQILPNNQELKIDVSCLPSGIYFIEIESEGRKLCSRFIKE